MIRALTPSDLKEVERIHSLYFAHEASLPDFMSFICAFVVEDERGIVTAGGVRPIVEGIIVTDKSRSLEDRMKALYHMLDAMTFVTQKSGYDQIYGFSQDPKWFRRLQKSFGFRLPQGQAIVLDL